VVDAAIDALKKCSSIELQTLALKIMGNLVWLMHAKITGSNAK